MKACSNTIQISQNEMGYEISFNIEQNEQINLKFDSTSLESLDDGSMLINKNGILVAALSSVKDNNNNKVNYLIKDNTIVITSKMGGDYSIQLYGVNDYSHWFNSSSWITRDENISLSINHKDWAYAGIETGPISWSWSTLVAKHKSDSRWKNEQGMKEQYMCHVNFAANKNPWNLEPWRDQVGYSETIANSFNP